MGKLEERLDLIEKALVEQGGVVSKYGAMVKTMADQANDLPAAVRTAVDELWENQRTMEWQIAKLLHLMDPDNFADPEPLTKEAGDAEPQEAGETEAAQPQSDG